jgi:hypothetical protein
MFLTVASHGCNLFKELSQIENATISRGKVLAKTTCERSNVTDDDKDAEEKRLPYELTAACAEMAKYDDDPAGPAADVFDQYAAAVRRCREYEESEGERKRYLDQLDSY